MPYPSVLVQRVQAELKRHVLIGPTAGPDRYRTRRGLEVQEPQRAGMECQGFAGALGIEPRLARQRGVLHAALSGV